MPVEKCRDEIRLVAVHIAGFTPADKITKQGFGDFGIGIRRQRLSEHRRRDRHIQQVQPAVHPRQCIGKFSIGVAKRVSVETARNRHVAAERVAQEFLIEALNGRQNS